MDEIRRASGKSCWHAFMSDLILFKCATRRPSAMTLARLFSENLYFAMAGVCLPTGLLQRDVQITLAMPANANQL